MPEHVAVVDQRLRDLLEELADAAGVAEVQVQVVDEEEEDAAGGVVGRPRRRQDDALLRRRRRRRRDVEDAAAVHEHERRRGPACTPSSKISKSSFLRSATNWPAASRTMTSVVIRSTPRQIGWSAGHRIADGAAVVVGRRRWILGTASAPSTRAARQRRATSGETGEFTSMRWIIRSSRRDLVRPNFCRGVDFVRLSPGSAPPSCLRSASSRPPRPPPRPRSPDGPERRPPRGGGAGPAGPAGRPSAPGRSAPQEP